MGAISTTPLLEFSHDAVIDRGNGKVAVRWNKALKRVDPSSDRVFSLQPNGDWDDRPDTAIAAWETGTIDGDRVVFQTEGARAVFGWQK